MSIVDNINIRDILVDIEGGKMTVEQIVEKHHITKYKYNQILKAANIKKPYANVAKAKNTFFQRILNEVEMDDDLFNLENFIIDCKNGMKISDLMEKYKLSLYQIRELRKKHELTTK